MKRIRHHDAGSGARARPSLDFRDLEIVLAVAEAGSTARAARSLHLTQPAVSRALLSAEGKLGTPLFERTARGLVPTAAGARLVGGAGEVFAKLVDLEHHARTPVEAPSRVRLVCECYTAYRWLPSTLARLEEGSQRLRVTLAPEHTADPVAALVEGIIDVAFLTTSPVRGSILERPLFSDEVVFVLSPAHPLASKKSIAPDDLRAHRLIVSTSTPAAETRWFQIEVFGRARPRLDLLRFPLTEAIVDAARAGMGVAVLSEWVVAPYLGAGDLVVRRLAKRPLKRPWRVAFRPEVAEVTARLVLALAGSAPRLARVD